MTDKETQDVVENIVELGNAIKPVAPTVNEMANRANDLIVWCWDHGVCDEAEIRKLVAIVYGKVDGEVKQ